MDDKIDSSTEQINHDELLAGIFQSRSLMIALTALGSGRLVAVNQGFLELLGYPREEIIGKTIEELNIYEDIGHRVAIRQSLIEQGFVRDFSTNLKCKSGESLQVNISSEVIRVRDEKLHLSYIALQNRSEVEPGSYQGSSEIYKKVVESIQETYFKSDLAGNLIAVNSSGAELLGYDSTEAMIGLHIATHFFDPPEQRITLYQTLEKEGKVSSYEMTLKKRDGTKVPILTSAHFYFDENGKPKGLEGIFIDISEKKKAERQLERLNRKLVKTAHLAGKAELATDVLHNVGNVLNSIGVTTELLFNQISQSAISSLPKVVDMLEEQTDPGRFITEDPKGQMLPEYFKKLSDKTLKERSSLLEYAGNLKKYVEHVKMIIAMQQRYARMAGIEEVSPLAEVIEDAIRVNETGFSRHNVELMRSFEELPSVVVDRHKVMQILVNLLNNAKYAVSEARDTGGWIRVELVRPNDETVEIAVVDNGVGIAEDNVVKLFSQGYTTKKDGHGFGLHSSANAAKQMNGELSVSSDGPGRGARFTLTLPFRRQSDPTIA